MGVAGNMHDLGLRMIGQRLQQEGFAVHHLGPNMPSTDLAWSLQDRNVDVLAMSASMLMHVHGVMEAVTQIRAVCDHAGFDQRAALVAHSFGGYMAVKAAGLFPDRFGALVLVDSGIRHPEEPIPDRPAMGGRAKVYPDRETALGRFRVQPPQSCENAYILEYIARHSLMPVDGGWAWKFDEDLPSTLKDVERTPEDYRRLDVPTGLIYGAESELFSARTEDYMRKLIPQKFPAVALPEAQHHLFLDQPLAFVAELKKMLATLLA